MLGWKCETFNIEFMQKSSSSSKYVKKLSELLKKGAYTRKKMEDLLGELGDFPLGDSSTQHSAAAPQRDRGRNNTHQSTLSLSTYLFGGSDRGELDDPPSPRTPLGCPSPMSPQDHQVHSHSADRNRLQSPLEGSWSGFSGGQSPLMTRQRRASHHRRSGRDRTLSLDLARTPQEAEPAPIRTESGQISQLGPRQDGENVPRRTQSGQISELGPRQQRITSLTGADALAKAVSAQLGSERSLQQLGSDRSLQQLGSERSLQQNIVDIPGAPQRSQVAPTSDKRDLRDESSETIEHKPTAPVPRAASETDSDASASRPAPKCQPLKPPTFQGLGQSSLMQRRLQARMAPSNN